MTPPARAWRTLGVLEVVSPQGADLVLATDVPHGEADVFVLHRLHVEPCMTGGQRGGGVRSTDIW